MLCSYVTSGECVFADCPVLQYSPRSQPCASFSAPLSCSSGEGRPKGCRRGQRHLSPPNFPLTPATSVLSSSSEFKVHSPSPLEPPRVLPSSFLLPSSSAFFFFNLLPFLTRHFHHQTVRNGPFPYQIATEKAPEASLALALSSQLAKVLWCR